MLKKDQFSWTPVAEDAFIRLKNTMTQAPVLALPDFSKIFIIECDASGSGVGAVLMQERSISFFSQALQGSNLLLSTYEKEILALVLAVQKWRPYILGRQFIVRTDHESLKHLWTQKITTPAQQRWLDVIKEEQSASSNVQRIIRLIHSDEAVGPWNFQDGILYFKGRIYLDKDSPSLQLIIEQFHNSTHEGFHKTLHHIRANFYNKGLRTMV
ncbi:ty3-gypsy retrotransposon protein [Tanacetum coccineum]